MRLVAYISGGVGGASLIGSGVFFLLMQQKLSSMEDLCGDDGSCRNDDLSATERDNAEMWNAKIEQYFYLTWGTLGVGVVGVATGVVLLLTSGGEAKEVEQTSTLSVCLDEVFPRGGFRGVFPFL